MIFSNHEFDKDQSYHDFLVSVHTKDLSKEFSDLENFFKAQNASMEEEDNGEND